MAESTITAKGQTTVPRQIREVLGAGPGTRLVWHVGSGGAMIVRAKTHSLTTLAGGLKTPGKKTVALDKMNPWG